jgi:hypothetical protein
MISNFFLLGAPKSGTSTLHQYLTNHPQVAMAVPKEPHFFASEFDRGLDYYRQTYLRHWQGEPILGDASTANMFLPWAVPRIAQVAPQAKLAVILRCPVQRAFSEWWMHHRSGMDPLSFPEAIDASLARLVDDPPWQRPNAEELWTKRRRGLLTRSPFPFHPYVEPGHYADHIERIWNHFPPEKLLVLWTDELASDPRGTLTALWNFLGVDPPAVQTIFTTREHRARGAVGEVVNRWVLRLRLHRLLPRELIRAGRDLLIALGDRPPTGDLPTLNRLAEHYRPHNERLSKMLNRPLPNWR